MGWVPGTCDISRGGRGGGQNWIWTKLVYGNFLMIPWNSSVIDNVPIFIICVWLSFSQCLDTLTKRLLSLSIPLPSLLCLFMVPSFLFKVLWVCSLCIWAHKELLLREEKREKYCSYSTFRPSHSFTLAQWAENFKYSNTPLTKVKQMLRLIMWYTRPHATYNKLLIYSKTNQVKSTWSVVYGWAKFFCAWFQ